MIRYQSRETGDSGSERKMNPVKLPKGMIIKAPKASSNLSSLDVVLTVKKQQQDQQNLPGENPKRQEDA